MDFDGMKIGEVLGEGIKDIGENLQETTANFHENFVSKITPEAGKFGEAGIFVAEMIPGVSEYNAIREGDWQRLATEVAIGAAVGVGIAAVGAGVSAVAGASIVGAVGIKAVAEVAETVVEKTVKEGTQIVAKAAVREGTEAVAEKAVKEGTEVATTALLKEGVETTGEQLGQKVTTEASEVVAKKVDNIIADGTHLENGKLRANVTYQTNEGYKYTTNQKGNISKVEGKLVLGEGERNLYAQRRAGGEDRLSGDDGGHLIASKFSGSGEIDNIVPMNSEINRAGGKWYRMETEWSDALKEGKEVQVQIDPKYKTNNSRPTSFKVKYTIDDEKVKIIKVLNRAGG